MTARLALGALFVLGVGLTAAVAWLWHPAACLLYVGLELTAISILGGAHAEREEECRR